MRPFSGCLDTVWSTLTTLCSKGTSTNWPGYARSGIIYFATVFVLSLTQLCVGAALAHNLLHMPTSVMCRFYDSTGHSQWQEENGRDDFPLNMYLDKDAYQNGHPGFTQLFPQGRDKVIWIEIIMPLVALLLAAVQLTRHWQRTVSNRNGFLTGVLGLIIWLIFPYADYSLRADPPRMLSDDETQDECYARDYWKLSGERKQRIGLGKARSALDVVICFFLTLYMGTAIYAAYLNRKTTQVNRTRATQLQNLPGSTTSNTRNNDDIENRDIPASTGRAASASSPRGASIRAESSSSNKGSAETQREEFEEGFTNPFADPNGFYEEFSVSVDSSGSAGNMYANTALITEISSRSTSLLALPFTQRSGKGTSGSLCHY
ncbi:hypothetical protein BDV96DRAFT_655274 [Lophiotrema nucula]|uniref:Uncharacterized protein n=1 Tax=Lophiotrema nucula TaxID=690887 RepID=A0A6A5YFW8_9PLEO|nr:hypothetical protein BDV96DRAFT_655274 [Lophiotrema nucula]